jgi:hypothetical protein
MQKLLTEWRKFLAEQVDKTKSNLGRKPTIKKQKWDSTLPWLQLNLNSLAEKARQHVINRLPLKNEKNRRKVANLLGKYFNPKLPKELKLTKKELLAFAETLGWAQYNQIKDMSIRILESDDWLDVEGVASNRSHRGIYYLWGRKIHINAQGIKDDAVMSAGGWFQFSEKLKTKIVKRAFMSTLIHELWHAVDHTDVRGDDFLSWGFQIPQRKKVAIKKIISEKFPSKWTLSVSRHGISDHVLPTGFMAVLNRGIFDELMSAKTYIRRSSSPEELHPWSAQDVSTLKDWQKYCSEGTERYVRFHNLIDAFEKINHPGDSTVTTDDIMDFCNRPYVYSALHGDLDCVRRGFMPCKRYTNWLNQQAKLPVPFGEDRVKKNKEKEEALGFEKVAATLNRFAKLKIPSDRWIGPPPAQRSKV